MDLDQYVHLQAQAVLKRVASCYPYITYDGTASLTTEQQHLGDQVKTVRVYKKVVKSYV